MCLTFVCSSLRQRDASQDDVRVVHVLAGGGLLRIDASQQILRVLLCLAERAGVERGLRRIEERGGYPRPRERRGLGERFRALHELFRLLEASLRQRSTIVRTLRAEHLRAVEVGERVRRQKIRWLDGDRFLQE